MEQCDVNTLLARANCFQCLDAQSLSVLETQLLCDWYQTIQPVGNFIITEGGNDIISENGNMLIVE